MPTDWIKRQSCAARRMPCRLSMRARIGPGEFRGEPRGARRRPSVAGGLRARPGRRARAARRETGRSPRGPADGGERAPQAFGRFGARAPAGGGRRPRGRRNTAVQKPAARHCRRPPQGIELRGYRGGAQQFGAAGVSQGFRGGAPQFGRPQALRVSRRRLAIRPAAGGSGIPRQCPQQFGRPQAFQACRPRVPWRGSNSAAAGLSDPRCRLSRGRHDRAARRSRPAGAISTGGGGGGRRK